MTIITIKRRKLTKKQSATKKANRAKKVRRVNKEVLRQRKREQRLLQREREKARKAAQRQKERLCKQQAKLRKQERERQLAEARKQQTEVVTPVKLPRSSYLAKRTITQLHKLSQLTGIPPEIARFLVSRTRMAVRYKMKTDRQRVNLNQRRGKRAEYKAVANIRSFGFYAQRVPQSGAGGMRGDVLVTLPTRAVLMIEVKFSAQFTQGNEKCIRLQMDWFETLDENYRAMQQYNVIAALFLFKYGFSNVFFVAIPAEYLKKLEDHLGVSLNDYQRPVMNQPFLESLEPVDTKGKSLTVRATRALRGLACFHTDTKYQKERTIYCFAAEYFWDWLEQTLKTQDRWYDGSIPDRGPRGRPRKSEFPRVFLHKKGVPHEPNAETALDDLADDQDDACEEDWADADGADKECEGDSCQRND